MTRRAEQIPLEDDWVLTKVWSKRQSAPAILAAVQAVPRDEAFIPALSAGPAFDSVEVVPPALPLVGSGEGFGHQKWVSRDEAEKLYSPNCDGNAQFGHEAAQAGYALAHAQHSAATEGDDCTSGACLITRGSD